MNNNHLSVSAHYTRLYGLTREELLYILELNVWRSMGVCFI